MEKNYIIVNIGSASKKYAVYRGTEEILRAHFEWEGDSFVVTIGSEKIKISELDFSESFSYLLPRFGEIAKIGVRIVAPGEYFLEHRIIDETYMKHLEEAEQSAPLHIRPILAEIKKIQTKNLGVPLVGVSDSVFHKDLPEIARTYAIPKEDRINFGIRRYGYHGISISSLVEKVRTMHGGMPDRMIICHLGGGTSVTAVRQGRSVDTSMGFTPLEGLVMATRTGDIDAGALMFLARKRGLSLEGIEEYLNQDSGLLGLSGKSADIRKLLELEERGDDDASLALRIYVEKIKKYIGAYVAVLGGVEALVFAGTVGERSSIIRERICRGLGVFDIVLDQESNMDTSGADRTIQRHGSRVEVFVLKTDEMREIFEEIKK